MLCFSYLQSSKLVIASLVLNLKSPVLVSNASSICLNSLSLFLRCIFCLAFQARIHFPCFANNLLSFSAITSLVNFILRGGP